MRSAFMIGMVMGLFSVQLAIVHCDETETLPSKFIHLTESLEVKLITKPTNWVYATASAEYSKFGFVNAIQTACDRLKKYTTGDNNQSAKLSLPGPLVVRIIAHENSGGPTFRANLYIDTQNRRMPIPNANLNVSFITLPSICFAVLRNAAALPASNDNILAQKEALEESLRKANIQGVELLDKDAGTYAVSLTDYSKESGIYRSFQIWKKIAKYADGGCPSF